MENATFVPMPLLQVDMQQKVIPQHGWKYSELCQASLNQLFAFHLKNLPAIPISKHPDAS